MKGLIMQELIKQHLTDIQSITLNYLKDITSGLRVAKTGSLQIFLNDVVDSSVQEDFQSAITSMNPDLDATYSDNLDEFGEPVAYKNSNGKKAYLSPCITIHPKTEPKSVEDMFSSLPE